MALLTMALLAPLTLTWNWNKGLFSHLAEYISATIVSEISVDHFMVLNSKGSLEQGTKRVCDPVEQHASSSWNNPRIFSLEIPSSCAGRNRQLSAAFRCC
jgi:hypothetical protein